MFIISLITLSTFFSPAVGKIEMGTLPPEYQAKFDAFKLLPEANVKKTPGESLDFWVTEQYKWETAGTRWPRANLTAKSEEWINTLRPNAADLATGNKRPKRQADFRPRIRKDYRMMTELERNNYHKAIIMLKKDTRTAYPNKYEAFIELNTGFRSLSAHGGAGFLPFYRVYLYMFENALREMVPDVVMPYWDFTLDADLPDPADSVVWTPPFFGSGVGIVADGPFDNWKLSSGRLVRNVAGSGPLMHHDDVEMLLRQTSLAQISYPTAMLTNIEFLFSGVLRFCGGNMASLETAAQDPVFFPALAYVDSIWERLRERQRSMGVDPELDYPTDFGPPYHGPNEMMGLGQFRNIDGLHNFFSEIIRYERVPRCTRINQNCGSPYLRCNAATFRCVSLDVSSVNSCSMRGLNRPTQNIFALNGRGDVGQWAYLPVKLICSRPPEFRDYGSYPIVNGDPQFDNDIFSPYGYSATRNLGRDPLNAPRGWSSCRRGSCCGGASEVYVQSNGLNYDGVYKDAALVQQKFALSSSVTYIAVKHPQRGQSVAILRAFDACGRMCSAACKVPGSNPERYELCSGVVKVSSAAPYMFGNNFGESLMSAWDFSVNKDCPTFRNNEIFMAFYCDYSDDWPFEAGGRRHMNVPASVSGVDFGGSLVHDAHLNHGFAATHRMVPKGLNKCEIDSHCVINTKCANCRGNGAMPCNGHCTSFAACEHGQWTVRECRSGLFFNPVIPRCTPGNCVLTDRGLSTNMDPVMSAIGMLNPSLVGTVSSMQQRGSLGQIDSISSLLSSIRSGLHSGLNRLSGTGMQTGIGLTNPRLPGTGTHTGIGHINPGSIMSAGRLGAQDSRFGTGLSGRQSFHQPSAGRTLGLFDTLQDRFSSSNTRTGGQNTISLGGGLQVSTGIGGSQIPFGSSRHGDGEERGGRFRNRGRNGRRNPSAGQRWLDSLLS